MNSFLRDTGRFFWMHEKMWLAPLIVMLLLLGAIILFAQGGAVKPFVYGHF